MSTKLEIQEILSKMEELQNEYDQKEEELKEINYSHALEKSFWSKRLEGELADIQSKISHFYALLQDTEQNK